MTCDRELLLTRSIGDPELVAHLERCPTCRSELSRLQATLDPFHAELEHTPTFSLETPRTWRSYMPQILVAAATLAVVGLAATQHRSEPIETAPAALTADFKPDLTLVEEVEKLKWNERTETEWLALAQRLEVEARRVVVQQPDTRDGLRVLLQTGRAAENANQSRPPFYDRVDGKIVNVYYFEATKVVKRRPDLRQTIRNDELGAVVDHYLDRLER